MPTYFCGAGGSDANSGLTWALRKATFAGAIAVANLSGDIIAVDAAAPPADVTANTTWNFLANVSVIASTNSGVSTVTPTTMGAATWLGTAGAFSITLGGAFRVYFYGITFRIGGSTTLSITLTNTDGGHFELEDCYLWLSNTNTAARIVFGSATAGNQAFTRLKNCTFRFGSTSQGISATNEVVIEGGSITSLGTIPSTLFRSVNNQSGVVVEGFDVSAMGAGTLVDSMGGSPLTLRLSRCRLGAGMTILATQGVTNKSSGKVFLFDCSSGDTHVIFGYYDAFGSLLTNTGIYYTTGAGQQSWQIVTTANCSFATPFISPWIDLYHTGTSAITPSIEILRDGSATAFTNAQVWGEFSVKTNSGFVTPSFALDRQALVDWAAGTTGANQAAGAGLSEWTGESGTAWSGKVDSSSAVTPAENGHIRGRLVVGAPSITVYMDPQIRI